MPILKKPKTTVRAPKWNAPKPVQSYGEKNCVFPRNEGKETRKFKIGEVVCVMARGKSKPIPAIYNGKADAGPDYHRVREGSMGYEIEWYNVGKFPIKTPDVVLESVSRQKNLPPEAQALIAQYRGKGRSRRLTKRRRRNV